jgi:hypothetical protein
MLSPIYVDICNHAGENVKSNQQYDCAANHIILVLVRKTGELFTDWTFVTTLATIVMAGFTGTLWWSTKGLLIATNESIKLAREEFISTHRPKIIVWQVSFSGSPKTEKPINITFRYVNEGESVAYITRIGTKLIHLFKDTLPSGIEFEHREKSPPMEIESGMHGCGMTEDTIDPSDPLLLGAIGGPLQRKAIATRYELFCVGYILYKDFNGRKRQTGFGRKYDPTSNRWVVIQDTEYEYSY